MRWALDALSWCYRGAGVSPIALRLFPSFFVINHPAGETIADAFHEALYCYSVRRELSSEMIQEIKQRVLPPEIFVELAQKYKSRGCDLAKNTKARRA